jgi:hypothetical protein
MKSQLVRRLVTVVTVLTLVMIPGLSRSPALGFDCDAGCNDVWWIWGFVGDNTCLKFYRVMGEDVFDSPTCVPDITTYSPLGDDFKTCQPVGGMGLRKQGYTGCTVGCTLTGGESPFALVQKDIGISTGDPSSGFKDQCKAPPGGGGTGS